MSAYVSTLTTEGQGEELTAYDEELGAGAVVLTTAGWYRLGWPNLGSWVRKKWALDGEGTRPKRSRGRVRPQGHTHKARRDAQEGNKHPSECNRGSLPNSAAWHSTLQHSTIQHNTVQYSTAYFSTVQHSTVQHSSAQFSTVQH